MPNHVQNRIHLDGKPEQIRQMLKKIQNEEYGIGTVDFEKILPMPDTVQEHEVIDWHIGNWGTKWNAYGYDSSVDYSKSENLEFWTAWSAPHPVIQKLSEMFPDIEFIHEWADEDLGVNCGKRTCWKGDVYEEYYPETNKECMQFACSVWGETPENMGYAFDRETRSYEYVGVEEALEQSAT